MRHCTLIRMEIPLPPGLTHKQYKELLEHLETAKCKKVLDHAGRCLGSILKEKAKKMYAPKKVKRVKR